jgi:hypothetical protein
MYSSLRNSPAELNNLVARFQERKDLLPLKARALKRLAAELKAISEVGLPWKEVWRTLRAVGYEGTYRQFVRMTTLLTTEPRQKVAKSKNLASPSTERGQVHPIPPLVALDEKKEKPEWQIRREAAMAELDRQAEENRAREARLNRPKLFNPAPFQGRGEE